MTNTAAAPHETLGEIYLYLKRPDEAIQELKRAIAIAPNMRKAHYPLGQAYAAKGMRGEAQGELEKAKAP